MKAIALIRRPADGAILVGEGTDPATGRVFHRPLGGNVEFGEAAAETVARELREELGLEVVVGALLSVIENRFTFGDAPGHEILFVYDASFVDEAAYAREALAFLDTSDAPDPGEVLVLWRTRDAQEPVLVPPELLDLL